MPTEYDTEHALATFRCGGVDPHLFLVSRWQGAEGVSQLYRFEIDLASADAGIDLEKLLGSRATLTLRTDAGDILPWHGIVTELRQTRRDETYAYYRAVLEPQLALLRLFRQSRVYLHADAQSGGKPDLASVIRMVLEQVGLTQEGDPDAPQTPHYAIRVPASDLAETQSNFICQFEETSLDFLMRRLEHAGVYFWFEQAPEREVVVFGNNRDQQPGDDMPMVWRPEGELNPEAGVMAVSRFDHAVSVQPRGVVLRDFSISQPSLDLTVKADVNPDVAPASDRFDTLGSIEVYGSHYKKQDHGERMAAIRAEEIACQRNRYFGEVRAGGLRAGYHVAMKEHFRDSLNNRYYVIQIEHEGRQSLPRQTAEQGDEGQAYHAHFTVLPAALQYRPARHTRKPRVVGFLSAIVMAEGDGQYAQMNEYGCYRIRFLFAPPGTGAQDDANSAWVRMATPYAGSQHGMNFPLLKGAEVLVSFLGGDPDRPVIVAAIPNEENPSIRNQDNATQPGLRTAGQNALEFEDRQGQEHARLSSPAGNTTIQLGTDANHPDQSGLRLATTAHMGATSSSYIQQVPGLYHQEIGVEGKVDLDPEPRMAFQAAWDAQKARQLEQQALLPDAPPALQLKALDARLAARKAAFGLLSQRLQAAREGGGLDADALAALMAEHATAKQALDMTEALLGDEQGKEDPKALLQQMVAAEQPDNTDQEPVPAADGDGDSQTVHESGVINEYYTAARRSSFTTGMVNEFIAGNESVFVGGAQTNVLVGVGVDIKAAGVVEVDLSPTITFDLKGKNLTTSKYLFTSAREDARALERNVQIVNDEYNAGTLEERVQLSYQMTVDGSYTVEGGLTNPDLMFSTGTSNLWLASTSIFLSSPQVILAGPKSNAELHLHEGGGTVSIKARNDIDLIAQRTIELKAAGQARLDGNMIRIG